MAATDGYPAAHQPLDIRQLATADIDWARTAELIEECAELRTLVECAGDRYGPWQQWHTDVVTRRRHDDHRYYHRPGFAGWLRWVADPTGQAPPGGDGTGHESTEGGHPGQPGAPAADDGALARLTAAIARAAGHSGLSTVTSSDLSWAVWLSYAIIAIGILGALSLPAWETMTSEWGRPVPTFYGFLAIFTAAAALFGWFASMLRPRWWQTRGMVLVASATTAAATLPWPTIHAWVLALGGVAIIILSATVANLLKELLGGLLGAVQTKQLAAMEPGILLVTGLATVLVRLSAGPVTRQNLNSVLDPLREAANAVERAMGPPNRCRAFDPDWAATFPARAAAPLRHSMSQLWEATPDTAAQVAELCRQTLDVALLGQWGRLALGDVPAPAPPGSSRRWWTTLTLVVLGVGPLVAAVLVALISHGIPGWLWVPVASLAVATLASLAGAGGDVDTVISRADSLRSLTNKP